MSKYPLSYYESIHKENNKLSIPAFEKQYQLYQNLLVVAASLDGILVSLHDNIPAPLHTRVVFLCLIIVLTIGVLLIGITLYNYAMLLERARIEADKEVLSAFHQDRPVSEVGYGFSKVEKRIECVALSSLLSTPVLLLAYTILKMFF